jgi:antitoxin YefM
LVGRFTVNAITLKEAKLNLERLVEQVVADVEPTIVVPEGSDPVVLLSLSEYSFWKDTLYLLSNPANADHLRRSIAELEAGNVQERQLLEVG